MNRPPFHVWRTARKEHSCDGLRWGDTCTRVIRPGDRYRAGSIPPHFDGINGEHWWSHRLCTPCATTYIGPADPKAVAS